MRPYASSASPTANDLDELDVAVGTKSVPIGVLRERARPAAHAVIILAVKANAELLGTAARGPSGHIGRRSRSQRAASSMRGNDLRVGRRHLDQQALRVSVTVDEPSEASTASSAKTRKGPPKRTYSLWRRPGSCLATTREIERDA